MRQSDGKQYLSKHRVPGNTSTLCARQASNEKTGRCYSHVQLPVLHGSSQISWMSLKSLRTHSPAPHPSGLCSQGCDVLCSTGSASILGTEKAQKPSLSKTLALQISQLRLMGENLYDGPLAVLQWHPRLLA